MSKKSIAKGNINATARGGIRTGNRAIPVAPVTVIMGGGSSLPAPEDQSTRTSINGPYAAPKKTRSRAAQDGPDFYDHDTGKLLRTYGDMVADCSDMQGAESARAQFLRDFPQYRMATEEELFGGTHNTHTTEIGYEAAAHAWGESYAAELSASGAKRCRIDYVAVVALDDEEYRR